MKRRVKSASEWVIERLVQAAGIAAIILVVLIFAFLLRNSLPIFSVRTLGELLAGESWTPTDGDGKFVILPLLMGTL